MISYIKSFFTKSENNSKETKNEKEITKIIKLYFNEDKKIYIKIEITNKMTCEYLHAIYHEEIASQLMKIKSTSMYIDFIIIDDRNKYINIKLDQLDIPWNYLINNYINLYYLPNFNDEIKNESFNETLTLINPNEYIIEDYIQQFNFQTEKFEWMNIKIDKEKLLFNQGENLWSIIFLSDINEIIPKFSFDEKYKKYIKHNQYILFQIKYGKDEDIILKVNSQNQLNIFIHCIKSLLFEIKEQKLEKLINTQNENYLSEIFSNQLELILSSFNINGLLSLKYTRIFFFNYIKFPLLDNLTNYIIYYKIETNKNNCMKPYEKLFKIVYLLKIKDYCWDDIKNINETNNVINFEKNIKDFSNINFDIKIFIKKNISEIEYNNIFSIYQKCEKILLTKNNNFLNENEKNKLLKDYILPYTFDNIYNNIINNYLNPIFKILIKTDKQFIYGLENMSIFIHQKESKFNFNYIKNSI